MKLLPVFSLLILLACTNAKPGNPAATHIAADSSLCMNCRFNYLWMEEAGYNRSATVCARFAPPAGFVRVEAGEGSFGEWLRGLPLLPEGSQVKLHDGRLKLNQEAQAAVINIDVGEKDLQQCADAVMRLRAEFLFAAKQYDRIAFNYTSGDRVDYVRWLKGRRIVAQGNRTKEVWTGKKYADPGDHAAFRSYMNDIFNYAGTLSLSRELRSVPADSMQPGDVFIHGGTPGHAEIVVDMAVDPSTGKKVFMLAQSYMPAQQPHILRNPDAAGIDPWYPLDFGEKLITPEYDFDRGELKRF